MWVSRTYLANYWEVVYQSGVRYWPIGPVGQRVALCTVLYFTCTRINPFTHLPSPLVKAQVLPHKASQQALKINNI